MKKGKLPPSFYQRDTITVAEELLGKKLVRILPSGKKLSGFITETEAYLGLEDPACHTFEGRRTPRVEAMYGDGGYSYVYMIYGFHFCLNVVTETSGVPEAVLIRGIEPFEGIEWMEKHRQKTFNPENKKGFTDGPGKLCEAMLIDKNLNAVDLQSEILFIEATDVRVSEFEISERVGIDYAGDAAFWPLRFRVNTTGGFGFFDKRQRDLSFLQEGGKT